MNDIFSGTPTVGSNEGNSSQSIADLIQKVESLEQHAQNLEQRVQELEQQVTSQTQSQYDEGVSYEESQLEYRKGGFFKKLKKIFICFIRPILDFIPKCINAVANLRKSTAFAR